MQNGRWADTLPFTPFGVQTLTASTNSTQIELGDRAVARLTLNVTAVAGTAPTLDIAIQTRRDDADTWRTIGTFPTANGVANQRLCFNGLDRFVRAVVTIGGTAGPSFTFPLHREGGLHGPPRIL